EPVCPAKPSCRSLTTSGEESGHCSDMTRLEFRKAANKRASPAAQAAGTGIRSGGVRFRSMMLILGPPRRLQGPGRCRRAESFYGVAAVPAVGVASEPAPPREAAGGA